MPRANASERCSHPVDLGVSQGHRRQRAGTVAGVDAGFFDVLHHPAEIHLVPVVEHVDVDLDGVVEESVDEDGVLGRGDGGLLDVGGERLVVVDDLHAAPAEHVGGAHQHRVADLVRHRERFAGAVCRAVSRRGQARLGEHPAEGAAVLGQVDGLRRGADDWHAGVLEGLGQPEGRLAPELHDDPGNRTGGPLGLVDLKDVFEGQRFEVEAAARVVVGGDGLWVAVDHDRVVAGITQRETGVHAGVVELDALTDPVGAGAEDDDSRPLPWRDLGLLVVRRVVVRGLGGELGRTGVDGLEDGSDAQRVPDAPDDRLRHAA
jgi:hypothetical protein